jgi:hypothetical protein
MGTHLSCVAEAARGQDACICTYLSKEGCEGRGKKTTKKTNPPAAPSLRRRWDGWVMIMDAWAAWTLPPSLSLCVCLSHSMLGHASRVSVLLCSSPSGQLQAVPVIIPGETLEGKGKGKAHLRPRFIHRPTVCTRRLVSYIGNHLTTNPNSRVPPRRCRGPNLPGLRCCSACSSLTTTGRGGRLPGLRSAAVPLPAILIQRYVPMGRLAMACRMSRNSFDLWH